MADQNPIEHLIQLMSKLPGLGPRSARRAVLHLMKRRNQLMGPLAQALADAALNTKDCVECGNISHAEICPICADPKRDTGEICVVSDVADLWAMERGGAFKGRYHVLGGTLSALDNVTPEDLRIPHLLARVAGTQSSHGAREVILALAATVDGQTTAHYIADTLRDRCKVSSLAQGVPVGGQLDYLDDGTIQAALRARKNYG